MKFDEIVAKYTADDLEDVKATVDELCKKGIARGCYQDYTILADVISVLTIFEEAVKERK